MRPALALVVAVENYSVASRLARLENTVNRAYEFVRWLVDVRGADPRDIFLCTSPKPAQRPSELPAGVHLSSARSQGIRSAAMKLVDKGRDRGADVFVLFSGHGARVDGSDVIMAADYSSHDPGDKCIRIDELQAWLLPAMGPGTHYWFVEACRTEVDFAIRGLTLPSRISAKGRAVPNDLFATAAGTAARATSRFPQALLDGLHGNGPAKVWVDGSYWVTFPGVVDVVREAVRSEGMDVDPRPAETPGRILQLTGVPDVTVTVDVRGAVDGERYRLLLSADRPLVTRRITWPEQAVTVPPGRYYVSLLRDGEEGEEKVAATSPPPDTAVAMYAATHLEFDRDPSLSAATSDVRLVTVLGPSARTARSRVSQGLRHVWLDRHDAPTAWRLRGGPLRVELFDRDEPVRSVVRRGEDFDEIVNAPFSVDTLFGDRFDLGDLSHRTPAEEVVDPDPALRLCLLAAAAIGDVAPYARAVEPLATFDDLSAREAGVYVLTPPGTGVMTVQSEPHTARLTPVENVKPACSHAAVRAEPAAAHRIHLQIPGADMVIATAALPGRITVIVVQPEQGPQGRALGWRVHQLALTPGHLASQDPTALLRAVRFSALVQRRIGQGRPAMAANPDSEHVQMWTELLEGRWPDPFTMLLAAYELVRRGALAGDKPALINLLSALREHGAVFAADFAVLDSLVADRVPETNGVPLMIDGMIALGHHRAMTEPPGMALDYHGPWTRWRAWPSQAVNEPQRGWLMSQLPPEYLDSKTSQDVIVTDTPSSPCARLLLGPALRHVGRTTAAVWVQTDRPAEVEVLGCRAATFIVRDQHYALVEVNGLEPGSVTTYEVHLNGNLAWPAPGSPWPASRIRTRGGSAPVRVVFGSCRHAKPDGPTSVAADGVDALDVTASRMADMAPEDWPDALLLLGDQVYADDPTPQTRRWLHSRRRDSTASPKYEVADFTEYARLYRDSWSDPEIRWLMSTVPTAMIFDDHDVRDDWNTSAAWRDWVTVQPWWRKRIRGALAAYWVYQHIGNLPPKERHSDPTWRAVQAADGDAWPVLQEMADAADADPSAIRWSFRWDVDGVRLVMVDTRCGRILTEGQRTMLDDAEFTWVENAISEDAHQAEHVLVGCSLPWLLPPVVHDVQSANEVACGRGSALGERIRQAVDLEHWAAFRDSFDRLAALLRRVAAGPHAPATISVLSGDVHHSYVARADVDGSPVYQLVCSPLNHSVPWALTALMRAAWFGPLATLVRSVVRRCGVADPALSWRLLSGPAFGNAVATLVFSNRNAEIIIERSGRSGELEPVARVELADREWPTAGG